MKLNEQELYRLSALLFRGGKMSRRAWSQVLEDTPPGPSTSLGSAGLIEGIDSAGKHIPMWRGGVVWVRITEAGKKALEEL